MTDSQYKLIEQFNKNIEWLRKNQTVAVPNDSPLETMNEEQAEAYLDRGRTWLRTRRIDTVVQPMNTNWYLIKDLDWWKEGKKIVYSRKSIERLKAEMRHMSSPMG